MASTDNCSFVIRKRGMDFDRGELVDPHCQNAEFRADLSPVCQREHYAIRILLDPSHLLSQPQFCSCCRQHSLDEYCHSGLDGMRPDINHSFSEAIAVS